MDIKLIIERKSLGSLDERFWSLSVLPNSTILQDFTHICLDTYIRTDTQTLILQATTLGS